MSSTTRPDRSRRVRRGSCGSPAQASPAAIETTRIAPPSSSGRFPAIEGAAYRSGDRVRHREDGELIFLGRTDDQVKISGQRVEPGESGQALASHPDLLEATVIAREDVPGHKHLVGYAVPRPGASPAPEELREHVAARLPAYMVPNSILLLEEAPPRTDRGKVDASSLPAPRREGGEWPTTARSPRSWPRFSTSTRSGRTRTSSSSAAPRCSRSSSSAACARPASRPTSAPFSRHRPRQVSTVRRVGHLPAALPPLGPGPRTESRRSGRPAPRLALLPPAARIDRLPIVGVLPLRG